jgi:branched-chain amino acid transport system substrate-binding protein
VLDGSAPVATSPAGLARRAFVDRYVQAHGTFQGFAPYASDAHTLIANAARLAHHGIPQATRILRAANRGHRPTYVFRPLSHVGMEDDSLAVFTANQGAWVRVS